jgi:hypothetical protein
MAKNVHKNNEIFDAAVCVRRKENNCPYFSKTSLLNYLRVKTELVPVSVSFTSMFRLASGVPNGTFSGIVTLKKIMQLIPC